MKKSVFLFLLTLLPLAANADESGTCGENLTWTYVEATKTLTISGEGEMQNYIESRAPWPDSVWYVIIEDGVTSIGHSAFTGYTSLTSVTIGNSVTSIGFDAFYRCTSLTSVIIGNSVTSISGSAFEGCRRLTVTFHCANIGSWFSGLSSIKEVIIGDEVTSIGHSAFQECNSLTSVRIGNSVTRIGDQAFFHCTSLTSVTIGNSVSSISEGAFSGCTSLTSITIPNSVTRIDERAFSGCTSLTSVTIGNSVNNIGKYAFAACSHLTSVDFGNSVEYIGAHAFTSCDLQGICFPASLKEIDEDAFKGELLAADGKTFYGGNKNISQVEIHAVRPPACTGKIFEDNVYRTAPLHVFTGSCEYYYSALGWNHFYTIYDDEIKYIQTDDGLKIVRQSPVFDLTGRKISNGGDTEGLKGIYIVDGKKVWFR